MVKIIFTNFIQVMNKFKYQLCNKLEILSTNFENFMQNEKQTIWFMYYASEKLRNSGLHDVLKHLDYISSLKVLKHL